MQKYDLYEEGQNSEMQNTGCHNLFALLFLGPLRLPEEIIHDQ